MSENFKIEIWKDIPEYEGIYQASNFGNVKSLDRKLFHSIGFEKIVRGKLLKPKLSVDGYYYVNLSKLGKAKSKKIHQLIAIIFLNHKPNGMTNVINHKNFIRTDNRVENLEIVSVRENNSKRNKKYTSEFIGVYWYKKYNKWNAAIYINGKCKNLGYFDSEIEASNSYQNELNKIQNVRKNTEI